MLEFIKGFLLEGNPVLGFVLSCQEVQGGYNVGKIQDKLLVEICESGEKSYSFYKGGWFPVLDRL